MRYSLEVLSVFDIRKIVAGFDRRAESSVWRVNASLNELESVQQSTLRSKLLPYAPFMVKVVKMILIY